ncbi:MAG: acyltransferase [Chlorobium sp.]|jgi:fucose 4-O-acetylase-like acetyltransferase|nr:acyltransferase [Chlorobium sp.]
MQLRRDHRLDIIKGICILGVVGIHFAGSFIGREGQRWEPAFYLGVLWNQIFTFAVPVFLFISGFLIGKYDHSSTATFYSSRLTRILSQYFLACLAWWILFPHATFIQDLTWDNFFIRLFYRGIHGTYFFVSALLQLIILAPLIRWLVNSTSRKLGNYNVFIFAAFLLILHLLIGNACFKGELNYYYYCLPSSLFWLFFFFFGLYAERLVAPIYAHLGFKIPFITLLLFAIACQAYNLYKCFTPEIAGVDVNLIPFDSAYSRPIMLAYDLSIVSCIALVVTCTQFNFPRCLHFFSYFGKYSYEIYLWHLIFLQYIAWEHPHILQFCERHPVMIIVICLITCIAISLIRYTYDLIISFTKKTILFHTP